MFFELLNKWECLFHDCFHTIFLNVFLEWILGVDDGSIEDVGDIDITVQIPRDILIPSFGDPLLSIVESTYSNLLQNLHDPSFFQDKAILAPKNTIVDSINDYMLDLISGEEKTYFSCDSPWQVNP